MQADCTNIKKRRGGGAFYFPYDGKSIGDFQTDAFGKHYHELTDGTARITQIRSRPNPAATEGVDYENLNLQTASNNNAPTRTSWIQQAGGNETKPASISAYLCIKY
jgi:hypothetical protein